MFQQARDLYPPGWRLISMPLLKSLTMALPTLDFGNYLHGTDAEKFELSLAIIQGFKDFGFVKLVNHGIPEETVKDFLDLVRPTATSRMKLTRAAVGQVLSTAHGC
jgi:hypothetical protein